MKEWIGVDFDGTLAYYDGWKGETVLGPPIEEMVERVKRWIEQGHTVKIFTARAYDASPTAMGCIKAWSELHIGTELEVTCVKDYGMSELWDDRAVQVVPNEGKPVGQSRRGL